MSTMNTMKFETVYKLQQKLDDPRYEGFAFKNDESLRGTDCIDDDFNVDRSTGRVYRLAKIWTPQEVTGRVRAFNDFPCVNLSIPAFSRRAVDALRDILEPNGELLPLISDVGEYYAYNITTMADVLDAERSEIQPFHIEKYVFFPERLRNYVIFTIPQDHVKGFVTQRFVDRVEAAGLKGFDCVKIWPLPEGISYWQYHREQAREKLRQTKEIACDANALVILLKQKSDKATVAEKQRVDAIMDEIDALLVDRKSEKKPVGNLQGHEYASGECRLFLTCPDVDVLVKKLRPWLETFEWPGPIQVLKRYGHFTDGNAPAKFIKINRNV